MAHASTDIDTALGRYVVTAESDCNSSDISLSFRTLQPKLSLPPGMSVLSCKATIVQVVTYADISALRWACTSPAERSGSACTGQYLEAQEWEDGDRLVVVGTEDEESLAGRLPFVQDDPFSSRFEYTPQSLQVTLPSIPAGANFGLHFLVAENVFPEPVDASAWFAVEMRHSKLAVSDTV